MNVLRAASLCIATSVMLANARVSAASTSNTFLSTRSTQPSASVVSKTSNASNVSNTAGASSVSGSSGPLGTAQAPAGSANGAGPSTIDGLSVDQVLARARAARGTSALPKSEIELWKIHELGVDGTLRRVTRGRDWSELRTRDQLVTAEGSSGGAAWRQNENGEVIVEQTAQRDLDVAGAAQAPEEKPAARWLEHLREPVDAYAVDTVARDGSTRRDFYDASTFRLIRRERYEYGIHSWEVFEDYTTNAAGRTFARHEYGGDDRPNNDWDQRLISDDIVTPVPAADVAIPANRRTLVEFPEGRTTVRLPARIVRGLIVVTVTIAGRDLDFILDSGADSIAIDGTVAERFGLRFVGNSTGTVAGDFTERQAIVPRIQLGDLTMRDVVVDAIPVDLEIDDQTTAVGLLGFDFLDGTVLTIDYNAQTVDATAPEVFEPPKSATTVATTMSHGVPEVSLEIGSLEGDRFVVDTGAQHETVVLFQHFMHLNERGFSSDLRLGYGPTTTTEMIGGSVSNQQVLLRDVNLGPWKFADIHGLLASSPQAFGDQDGLIGSQILDLFKLTLDEAHARLYLEPGELLPAVAHRRAP